MNGSFHFHVQKMFITLQGGGGQLNTCYDHCKMSWVVTCSQSVYLLCHCCRRDGIICGLYILIGVVWLCCII